MTPPFTPADTERIKDRTTIKKLRQERDGLMAQARNLERLNNQLSKRIDTLARLPTIGIPKGGWQPIETAPRDANIVAKIWHACRYYIVEARPWRQGERMGWVDVDPESCVAWTQGVSKPGYWFGQVPARTEAVTSSR
jgi:hypothetical protein